MSTAIEEVMYKYDAGGHPYAVVRKLAGDPTFRALRMNYDSGGKLWLAESWEWIDGGNSIPANVALTTEIAMEEAGGGIVPDNN